MSEYNRETGRPYLTTLTDAATGMILGTTVYCNGADQTFTYGKPATGMTLLADNGPAFDATTVGAMMAQALTRPMPYVPMDKRTLKRMHWALLSEYLEKAPDGLDEDEDR
jgi:hypothetical protein